MQFNSASFILIFLPAVVAAYYIVAVARMGWLARPVLILATLVFYGLGGPQFVPILLASVVLNHVAGRVIERVAATPARAALVLALAVLANLLVLGYFKYFNFLLESVNRAFGPSFAIEAIILPLGISFFTFQQIGYLVDIARSRTSAGSALDYASFTLFFPQLLAGPIVQYRETAPQFQRPPQLAAAGHNILIGLALFAIGLFKKTVVADTVGLYAAPVYAAARAGEAVGFVDGWLAAFAYLAQVYFDFSGYSDMAIGTARMFGIILPLNFYSPLRSQSIVEIWRRWHVTLGRWVQSYVFQPIAMQSSRFAAGRGMGAAGMLAWSVVIPTMISMLIIGIWHGAGWTFVIFGLMQGIYMSANEIWAHLRKKARKARKGQPRPAWKRVLATAATLAAFALTLVPFGSPDLASAGHMVRGMSGLAGALASQPDWPLGATAAIATVGFVYAGIFLVPNSMEIMARFEPVLDWQRWRSKDGIAAFQWRMTLPWALLTGLVLFLGFAFIMRGSAQFIYFGF